jgi:hypothetical protein
MFDFDHRDFEPRDRDDRLPESGRGGQGAEGTREPDRATRVGRHEVQLHPRQALSMGALVGSEA